MNVALEDIRIGKESNPSEFILLGDASNDRLNPDLSSAERGVPNLYNVFYQYFNPRHRARNSMQKPVVLVPEPQFLDGGATLGFMDGHAETFRPGTDFGTNNPRIRWTPD